MEEERIKELFSDYKPELSSSLVFIERLERNLNAVELIHQENAAVMKRNRIAVAIASLAGFITGVIFTLLYPYLYGILESITSSFLTAFSLPYTFEGIPVIVWLIIAAISALVALNTYTLSSTLLSTTQGVHGSSPSVTTRSKSDFRDM